MNLCNIYHFQLKESQNKVKKNLFYVVNTKNCFKTLKKYLFSYDALYELPGNRMYFSHGNNFRESQIDFRKPNVFLETKLIVRWGWRHPCVHSRRPSRWGCTQWVEHIGSRPGSGLKIWNSPGPSREIFQIGPVVKTYVVHIISFFLEFSMTKVVMIEYSLRKTNYIIVLNWDYIF